MLRAGLFEEQSQSVFYTFILKLDPKWHHEAGWAAQGHKHKAPRLMESVLYAVISTP